MGKQLILIVGVFLITCNLFSQATKKFIDSGTVKNQFDYLYKNSNRYQDYKVVKSDWLLKLKANTIDSITQLKNEVSANANTINGQLKNIDSLKATQLKLENNIATLTTEKQSISFLGIQFKKAVFKTILFLIIGVLGFLLLFFITKFKQSNSITTQTKLTLKEVEEEFDTHRKRALEREQKVMRKLQDELNKQKKE